MDISLRSATEDDIGYLLALRDKTMRQYLEDVGLPTSVEGYEERVRFEFAHAKIVEIEGAPAGLFKATYDQERNYWYLVQIQVDPKYQGLQIGSQLIQDLIAKAKETGARVGLNVIKTNPAKKLYLRLGFKVVDDSGPEHLMEQQA